MHTIAFLTQLLLLFLSVFLMIIVLLQRGRGGGLAGAFGGLGGQSAFGTKAGDMFTRITVVVATAWVLVAGGSGWFLRAAAESRSQGLEPAITAPEGDVDNTPPAEPLPPSSSTNTGPATPRAGDAAAPATNAVPPAAPEQPQASPPLPAAESSSSSPAETPSEPPAATPSEPSSPPDSE